MFSSQKNLGITITDNMDWGKHISESSYKATKAFDFFRRNLAFAPWSTKEVAFKTLVHSKLEYADPFGALTQYFILIRLGNSECSDRLDQQEMARNE